MAEFFEEQCEDITDNDADMEEVAEPNPSPDHGAHMDASISALLETENRSSEPSNDVFSFTVKPTSLTTAGKTTMSAEEKELEKAISKMRREMCADLEKAHLLCLVAGAFHLSR